MLQMTTVPPDSHTPQSTACSASTLPATAYFEQGRHTDDDLDPPVKPVKSPSNPEQLNAPPRSPVKTVKCVKNPELRRSPTIPPWYFSSISHESRLSSGTGYATCFRSTRYLLGSQQCHLRCDASMCSLPTVI